jgi:hypothetical protein
MLAKRPGHKTLLVSISEFTTLAIVGACASRAPALAQNKRNNFFMEPTSPTLATPEQ